MPLSKNDLIALIDSTIVTNGNEQLSAADFRSVQQQIVDSALNEVDGDSRLENYSVSNSSGTVSNVFAAGDTLNAFTLLAEIDEAAIGQAPTYYNVSNIAQATYLDETSDKFLFPSNLNTYSTEYVQYQIRITLIIDYPAVSTNQSTVVRAKLVREVDDSVVADNQYLIHNHSASTAEKVTFDFTTFVNTESDPYVVDGMYVEIENMALSSTNFTLTEFDIRLFKS